MSWVALDDVVGAIRFALAHPHVAGPVNVVSPHPATNAQFTKTLGRVLSMPTVLPMPAFAARLAFGEMADALLLSSTRVVPQALTATGYEFQLPELERALRHLLGK
jgi:NAD dependent epimerase/dehydratase family enzyme